MLLKFRRGPQSWWVSSFLQTHSTSTIIYFVLTGTQLDYYKLRVTTRVPK